MVSLVVLERVSLAYGAQRLFDGASLRVDAGEKIGLIGPNGAGKSTLLKLLVGKLQPDEGLVRHSKHCHLGYLTQDIPDYEGLTVLEAVLSMVPGRLDTETRLSSAEAAIEIAEDPSEQMDLAQVIAELSEQLTHLETFYSEHQAVRILKGLGFSQDELGRMAGELSGGWRMRVALAGLLFQQPDLLLLDEPTNHLDMPSVLWLDNFLGELRSATILVCHDRTFLNRHVKRVVSLEPEGLRSYKGNYDAYLEQRAEEEEIRTAERKNQERKLEEMERFVERFKAKATKARQAQSRARRVKRLRSELEGASTGQARKILSFRFPPVIRSGRRVVELSKVDKAFGANVLYDSACALVERGDRIAIVGRNGAGKTTLLRMLAGELAVDAGAVNLGSSVELGYYAQHHSDVLNAKRTVLEEVWRVAPSLGQTAVRSICGAFLFSRDEVEKAVGVLSGGERARVLLARLLVNPGNLLLMDEPTNHLDVTASEALAAALQAYDGTLIFVSHNTAFVDAIATRIWEVGEGGITDYPGDFSSWRQHQSQDSKPLTKKRVDKKRVVGPRPQQADAQRTVSSRLLREREKQRRQSNAEPVQPQKTVRRRRARTKPSAGMQETHTQNGLEAGTQREETGVRIESTPPKPSHRRPNRMRLRARLQELEESLERSELDLAELQPSDAGFAKVFAKYRQLEEEIARVRSRLG
jgi:ATP-binding cassette subfamily F protein 3